MSKKISDLTAATTPLADFEAKETNREGLAELDRMTEAVLPAHAGMIRNHHGRR